MNIANLSEAFFAHSRYMLGYSEDTIRRYATTIRLLRRMMGITTIEQSTEEAVHDFFYRGRRERQWSASTFATYRRSLVVFFRWCVRAGYLRTNPVEAIPVPRQPRALPARLTELEARRLLDYAENLPYPYRFLRYRNHAIIATFLHTGLRKNELLRLRVVDVDLDECALFVRHGKGGKDRILPISPQLAGILGSYAAERARLRKTCPEFFTSLNRDLGFTRDGLKRLVADLRVATRRHFTVHQLRHTFATLMIEGGSDIYAVSRMLGHSDIRTTTIYLAATPKHLREQVARHPLNTNAVR